MEQPVCTTVRSDASSPAETTITHEMVVTQSTTTGTGETADIFTYEFKIVSESYPNVFRLSGDCKATEVTLEKLEPSLAGTMLLIEYDGKYGRILTWLWKYWLSRDSWNVIQVGASAPDLIRSGISIWIVGGTPDLKIHKTVLESKWSGRLYLQEYRKDRGMMLSYLWQDIKSSFPWRTCRWIGH